MGRQLIAMGMRMRSMPLREGGLFEGLVIRMRKGVVDRMMPGILKVSFPIHPRSGFW
jgi:hypothetical protein